MKMSNVLLYVDFYFTYTAPLHTHMLPEPKSYRLPKLLWLPKSL